MGFFDKLKRAFAGVEEHQPNTPQTKSTAQPEAKSQSIDQVAEKTDSSEEKGNVSASANNEVGTAQPKVKAKPSQAKNDDTTNAAVQVKTSEKNGVAKEPEKPTTAMPQATKKTADDSDGTVPQSATITASKPTTASKNANLSSASNLEDKFAEVKRYQAGLKKSSKGFGAKLNALLANFRRVDEDFFDDLEETLIEADVGYEIAVKLTDELRDEVKLQNVKSKQKMLAVIVDKLVDIYAQDGKNEDANLHFAKAGSPTVFLFVGVNGVGKTTTIGKLAHRYEQQGKKVLLAAGDTFRAGAIEQLQEWGKRTNVPVVAKAAQSDPAAVVFDAVKKAKAENYDILLVDTAGRLQNKVNLMNELAKMKRIITRELPDAPQEVLLALDATTGQNALTQAKQFKDVVSLTGLILTKLDGTARGGIILAIRHQLKLPVKLVGLGEQMDDLRDFDAQSYMYGLFSDLVAD